MNVLPDGYSRVFHPHRLVANLVIYEMANYNQASHGYGEIPEVSKAEYSPVVVVETPKSGDTGASGGSGGSGGGGGGNHRKSVEEYVYHTY